MKFEFDGDVDRGECVAYIDDDGDLWITAKSGVFPSVESVVFFNGLS